MTQREKIINHLTTRRSITSVEAIGLYGITRLAAVVHRLKNEGYDIEATLKHGVNKTLYAEYSLN